MAAERASAVRRARALRVAGLYAITPDERDTGVLVAKVAAALEGGAAIVQYRTKAASSALRAEQARALARLLAVRGGLLIVNDDPGLARDVDADGVHVGDDAAIAAARAAVGADRLVGASCYDDAQRARTAVEQGADYVAFGSFFASTTKPDARHADTQLLVRARALGVPVVAIGGITAANAPLLIEAGASAVAVIADVFAHENIEDVARAARAFAHLFGKSKRVAHGP